MKVKEKNKLIPKLRFPEFKDSGEWEIREVGDIFQVTRGYVLAMSLLKDTPSKEYPYPVFSSQTKNNGLAGYYNEYLYENAITWTTDGANAGDVNYRKGKFYCTNVCGVLLNDNGYANICIAELINSVAKKHVSYVGNPKLMNGVMSKIKIPVPDFPEQQKIAAFLSNLDELIEAHKQKLELLKRHKKGLMQNLFPQEGEKVPKLRFPEFKDSGEWEEKKLGDFIKERNEISNKNNSLFSLTIDGGIIPKSDRYERSFLVKNEKEAYKKVYPNDFVYNPMNLRFGAISQYKGKEVIAVSKYYNIFNCKESMNSNFCDFYFKSNPMIILYNNIATGSLTEKRRVHFTEFLKIKIPFPPLPEQQKIASCLSSIDELITAEAEKIKQLEKHKKGLMQGVFPQLSAL